MSLAPITHPSLGVPHGFFTREGGVSSGVYSGLNCGRGSQDQAEAVAVNRGRVAAHMGVGPDALVSVHQVHSPDVAVIDAPPGAPVRADAMVTRNPDVALGILTADCGPLLLADAEAGVVGAAHAGWGGALGGVIEATVEAMEAQGAGRGRIAAVLGPTIGPASYEVGPEFAERFQAADPDNADFFAPGAGDRLMFDLPAFILSRLRGAGVAAEWTGDDTYPDERFFSYRRSVHRKEGDYGRMVAAIRAPAG